MTVAELKKKLKRYPKDMPVFAVWEGCHAYINPEEFKVEPVSKGNADDVCDCLVINVNEH